MSWFATKTAPVSPAAPPHPDTCAACHVGTEALVEIALPEFGRTQVCGEPATCRQRAQLLGIYARVGGA